MLYEVCYWFIIFLSYSVLGWLIEVISCSVINKKLVKDRGFLIGPYCPIWGWGAVLILMILSNYKSDPKVLFLFAVVGSGILEYITSSLMEKLFKARWWDYSDQRFNIEGRVCLSNCILFGFIGLFITYLVNPLYEYFLGMIPNNIFIVISIVLLILFLIDNIVSFTVITKIKSKLVSERKDSTEDIEKEVKAFLSKNKFFVRHIFRSFPAVNFKIPNGNNIANLVKTKLDEFEVMLKKQKKENKNKNKSIEK